MRGELAFYRKYTEAIVGRCGRVIESSGREPSLLGRELFRGDVNRIVVENFGDAVNFCVDVEGCIAKLAPTDQEIVEQIAMRGYTLCEAARLSGLTLRDCVRRYGSALDRLSAILIESRLLPVLCGVATA